MNKQLRKAIMTRTRLLNKLRKFNCPENQLAYKRQRNYCVKLLKRSKKDFYNNLNVKKVTDNKHFWKTIEPNFTDKNLKDEKIVLVEDDKVITGETDLAKIFKDHFKPVVNAIKNFSKRPSILKIKENTNSSVCFSFHTVSKEDLLYQLSSFLDPTKAAQNCDIPRNIIKKNYRIFSESLFSEQLKFVALKPVFKKDSRNDKRNYRPVSILPNISKIYERLLYNQLETYFESILSRYQCGFRKVFSVLTTLLPMIEKWRESLDSGGNCGALSTVYLMTYLLLSFMHADQTCHL